MQLKRADVDSYILDADLLLAGALGVGRIDLRVNRDVFLTDDQTQRFEKSIHRRSRCEPVDYILGHREFMGLAFKVDRRVLVPRPSTELVVEKVLQHCGLDVGLGSPIRPHYQFAPLIVDIGTGCGAAAISIAHFLPLARVIASDISSDAIAVATENVIFHDLSGTISLVVADMQPPTRTRPDLLVANLPYIPSREIRHMQRDVRDFEPRIALDGGSDGFDLHRRLIQVAEIRRGGAMFLEIGYDHADLVRRAAWLRSPDLRVEIFTDLVGFDRVVAITGWN